MGTQRVLKVVLVLAGIIFLAGIYPLVAFFSQQPSVPMIMSLYVTLGVFLLLASRNPSSHRSLIAFAGWANVAHAGVMAVQAYRHIIEARELLGVAIFGIVGVALILLTPAQQSTKQISAAAA